MTHFQFTVEKMQTRKCSQFEEDLRSLAVTDGGNSSTMKERKESGRRKKKADKAEKLKELHFDLPNLIQSEAEAVRSVAVLRQKSPATEATLPGKVGHVQDLQAQLAVKDQEIRMLEAELQTRAREMSEKLELVNQLAGTAVPLAEPWALLQEKEKQVSELLNELAGRLGALELRKKKNNQLQEENSSTVKALAAKESLIRDKLGHFQKLGARLIAKDQEIHELHFALETRTEELAQKTELLHQQSRTAVPLSDLRTFLQEKEKQVWELQKRLSRTNDFLEFQRNRNTRLREANWREMEALSATHSVIQGKLGKVQELQVRLAVKDQEIQLLQTELEKRILELRETIQPGNKGRSGAVPSAELQALSLEKQVADLQEELAMMDNSLDLKRRRNHQLWEKVSQRGPSPKPRAMLLKEEKRPSDLQKQPAETKASVELQRKEKTELQEKNCDAPSAADTRVQEELGKLHEHQALLVVKDQKIQMLQQELEVTTRKLRENIKLAKQNCLTHQYFHQSFRLWFLRRRIRCWICRRSWPRQKRLWRLNRKAKGTLSFRRNAAGPCKLFQPQSLFSEKENP